MNSHTKDIVDVFVIGGGINGVGVTRDAAGQGFSVCLCETNDLAFGTSSTVSKLIHGGLRYLKHCEVGLVRKALQERKILLKMAPHIVSPMRFILPHSKALRPWWLLRMGLFVYNHLGRRRILPGTRSVNFAQDPAGFALKSEFLRGFEYSNCWMDNARLVILNAIDAAQKGADLRVRTKVQKVERETGLWRLGEAGRTEVAEQVHAQFPFLDIQTTRRLVRLYGTNAHSVLSEAESVSDLGQHFGCELYQAEVEYLIDNKWAYTAEDILYRRTKLGIVMSEDGVSELQAYLENRALEEINIPRSPQYIYPPLIPSFKRPDLCLS